jgi:hypothetical protein
MARIKDWLSKERVSNRVKNCLRAEGYKSKDLVWHDFHNHPKKLVLSIPQFGDISMAHTEKWLRGYVPTKLYTTVAGEAVEVTPAQQTIFEQIAEFEREPDSFDLIADWMGKAATAIDINTKLLQALDGRIANIEQAIVANKRLNDLNALLKSWGE